jgi:hypothetical protein
MSVPKSKRKPTTMQFLHTARVIQSFCVEHWDRENSALLREIVILSTRIHAHVSTANSIYPENQTEAKERRMQVKMALAFVYSLKHQVSVAYRYELMSTGVQKELNEHLEHEKALLKGLLKKDKERYKGLPL